MNELKSFDETAAHVLSADWDNLVVRLNAIDTSQKFTVYQLPVTDDIWAHWIALATLDAITQIDTDDPNA